MKKTVLILATLSLSIFSCSKNDPKNQAPNSFEISVVSSQDTGESLIAKGISKVSPGAEKKYKYSVTWTDAIDPDGDSVSYDVEIEGSQIAEDITIKSAVIYEDDLADGASQTVTVIAKDSNGATTTVDKDFTKVGSKLEESK